MQRRDQELQDGMIISEHMFGFADDLDNDNAFAVLNEGSSVGPGLFGGVHHHACNMQFSVEDFRRAQEASSCVLPFVSPFPFMNLLHFLTSSVHAPELTVI